MDRDFELVDVLEWNEAALGPRPAEWQQVAPAIHKEVHTSLRPFLSGQHELRAGRLAAAATKHVAALLGALSVYQLPSTANPASERDAAADSLGAGTAASGAGNGATAVAGGSGTGGDSIGAGVGASSGDGAEPARGASHLLLFHSLCTPMDDMVLSDSTLCTMAFDALRDFHKTMVHGDVNTRNMVWDPTGYFFQFVDLELSTWRVGDTRVVSDALAIDPPGPASAHGSTPSARLVVHGTLEYCSCNQLKGCWPTAADDVASLFWSTLASMFPKSLWWGGLDLAALQHCVNSGAQVKMQLPEEANLMAYAQMIYLTSNDEAATLSRQHTLAMKDAEPLEFAASAKVVFVPATATPLQRWKHYVARAFAARHLLRLALSSGTADEDHAIQAFYTALPDLLAKLTEFDFAQCQTTLTARFKAEGEALTVLRESHSQQGDQLTYGAYLDMLDTSPDASPRDAGSRRTTSALCSAVAMDRCTRLRTSGGREVWGAEQQAAHAASVLASPPWRCADQEGEEKAVSVLRQCCSSVAMGHASAVNNVWDNAILSLQPRKAIPRE